MKAKINVQPGSAYAHLNGQSFTVVNRCGTRTTVSINGVSTDFYGKEVILPKPLHSAFFKIRGIRGVWAKPGDFCLNRCDGPHEVLDAIFFQFIGLRPFERLMKKSPAWKQWVNDAPEFLEVSEGEQNRIIEEIDTWLQDRGEMLPHHFCGLIDGKPGIWWNGDASPECERDTVDINERGNVTYYRNKRELFSYV